MKTSVTRMVQRVAKNTTPTKKVKTGLAPLPKLQTGMKPMKWRGKLA